MPAARSAARLFCGLAVAAAAALPLLAVAPAGAATDPLAGRTVVGKLVQAWPESARESAAVAAAPLSWVQPAHGKAVRVSTAELADVPAGATVKVTVGSAVSDAATRQDGYGTAHSVTGAEVLADSPAATTAPATPDPAGLTDQVTVAMVVPAGGVRDGATLDQVVRAVNGPVAQFWSEQSGGAVTLGVTAAHDWLTTSAGCGDPTALWDEVATDVGFVPGPGKHLLLYVSSRPDDLAGCSYGLAQVGSGLHDGGDLYVRDVLPTLIAHELGHNFGLGHSSARLCDGVVDLPSTDACTVEPYRDYYDVMGASWEEAGALDAAQADRLGLLPAAQQQLLDSSAAGGTVTLAPLSARSGTRALQLRAADGTDYWVEYRAAVGDDAWLATPANRFDLQAGVLVHRAGPLPDTSLLLDGTPQPRAGWADDLQDALPVGTAVPLDGFTITVLGTGPDAATVQVAVAAPPAAPPAAAAPAPAPATPVPVLPAHRAPAPHAATGPAIGPATGPVDDAPAAGVEQPVDGGTPAAAAAPGTPVHARTAALVSSPSSTVPLLAAAIGGALLVGGTLAWRIRNRRRGPRAAR